MSDIAKTVFCASSEKPLLPGSDVYNHLTTDEGNNIMYLNLSTNLTLKQKRHMYYFLMDFEKLTLVGLIDTGALTSAIFEATKLNFYQMKQSKILAQISKLWWQMVNAKDPLELFSLNSR